MKFESRIITIQANATEILHVLELQLAGRIVYLSRAYVVVSLARDTIEVMARTEAAGVPSDFTEAWHTLRERLVDSQKQFERILASCDCASAPCQH